MKKIILNSDNVIIKIATEGDYAHIVGIGKEAHWELCTEEIARQDYLNRCAIDEKIIDGGIFFPQNNLVMPFSCGADRIIAIDVPDYVTIQEYKYENGEFVVNIPVRIEIIKKQLEELDSIINRATEDLYISTGTAAYSTVQEVINKKNALRAELSSLELNNI